MLVVSVHDNLHLRSRGGKQGFKKSSLYLFHTLVSVEDFSFFKKKVLLLENIEKLLM